MPGLYDSFTNVGAQSLEAAGQYAYAMTGSARNMADVAQKTAETQDYTSQAAKDMRQSQYQAKMSDAQLQVQQNQATKSLYDNNPDLLGQVVASGAYDAISKHQASQTNSDLDTINNTVGQAYNIKDGSFDPTTYSQQFDKVPENLRKGWPTPDQVQSNPQSAKEASVLLAHSAANSEQKNKDYMQGQVLLNKNEIAENNAEVKLKVGEMLYQRGIEMMRIAGGSKEKVAEINGQYRLAQTNARNDAISKGSVADLRDFPGTLKEQLGLVGASITEYMQENGINLDKSDNNAQLNGLLSNSMSAAQDKYIQLKDQYLIDKKAGKIATPPPPPTEIATDIAKTILADPDLLAKSSKGFVFKTDSVKSSAASDQVRPQTPSVKISQSKYDSFTDDQKKTWDKIHPNSVTKD